ncbi:ribulose-phosphate 3-epimerase [Micromonospora sp. NPDC018662]|uniref:ribulose-phosphate 3-epimerase n=1 Tax=Micromonospora sp. NPDC018662 TaxID=3364238 RepID=UPI0037AA7561
MRISLSLWSMDQASVADEVRIYQPLVDSFHVDVMDGRFADDLLFGPLAVQTLRRLTDRPVVAHLMVSRPDRWLARFVDAGADTLVVHPSACDDLAATVDAVRRAGARAGVAIGLDEPSRDALDLVEALSVVLVMATPVGVKGRAFDPAALETVADACRARGGAPATEVYVDGGIRTSSVADIAAAGADGVVAGSILTGAADPAAAARGIHRLGARG